MAKMKKWQNVIVIPTISDNNDFDDLQAAHCKFIGQIIAADPDISPGSILPEYTRWRFCRLCGLKSCKLYAFVVARILFCIATFMIDDTLFIHLFYATNPMLTGIRNLSAS